jgi:hypothetical protein
MCSRTAAPRRDHRLGYELSASTQRSRRRRMCKRAGGGLPAISPGGKRASRDTRLPAEWAALSGHPYGVPGWAIPFDYDGDGYQIGRLLLAARIVGAQLPTILRWLFTRVQRVNFLGFCTDHPGRLRRLSFDYNGDGNRTCCPSTAPAMGGKIARSNGDVTFTGVSTGNASGHPIGLAGLFHSI